MSFPSTLKIAAKTRYNKEIKVIIAATKEASWGKHWLCWTTGGGSMVLFLLLLGKEMFPLLVDMESIVR